MSNVQHRESSGVSEPRIGAVVLAAGRSSRMGTSKPLLPLHGVAALARVTVTLREAGAGHLVVVTGHDPGPLLPLVERLGVERAHNQQYELGMFSSIQTGVAGLDPSVEAFFVLPVDCPLVTPRVLGLLLARHEESGKGIVYPECCGRRGHPPLLSSAYIPALLAAEPSGNLQAFLREFAEDETGVDVRDLTVLLDMDTPEEHQILDRFAAFIDRMPAPAMTVVGSVVTLAPSEPPPLCAEPHPEPSLTEAEALFLLSTTGTPANIVGHCRAVAAVGQSLAQALSVVIPALDVALVRTGCLLHDLAKLHPGHAVLARDLLANLGLTRLGMVVGQHMVIAPELPRRPGVSEAELVYLADKLVADAEFVGLEERKARALRKTRPDSAAAQRVADRIADARLIADKITALLGTSLQAVLAANVVSAGVVPTGAEEDAEKTELQVFLVRHAQTSEQAERRFTGQADPPLDSTGREQAEALAHTLANLTGKACFDGVHSSDLLRCRQTAEIIADGCSAPVQLHRWLREIDVGLWEGLTWDEAQRRYPAEHARREQDLVHEPFPQGESFADLRARVIPGFLRLLEEAFTAGARRLLVVGHKGVNRVILAHAAGLPLDDLFSIEQRHCSAAVLRVTVGADGGRRVTVGQTL